MSLNKPEVTFDDVSGDRVTYRSEHPEGDASGFLYGNPLIHRKGIVLLHEWWGVDDFTRQMATKMSNDGFTVLIADCFRGKVFTEPKKARENMMQNFNYQNAAMDVNAAARYLKLRGCLKVGATGVGMGASLGMVSAAAEGSHLDAMAPNCGCPKAAWADLTKITCPIQGHYASRDKVVGVSSPADYNAMAEKLWGAGVSLEMCIYEADHAFLNYFYSRVYSETSSNEFYENLYRFMNEKLA